MASVQGMLAAFKARDRDGAAAEINAMLRTNAPLGDTWAAVSRMAATLGEFNASMEAARRAAAMYPGSAPHQLQYASMVANAGRVSEALNVGEAALKLAPGAAPTLHFIGTCRAQIGDAEGAAEVLERALASDPSSAPTWLTVAMLKKIRPGDALVGKIEAQLAQMRAPEQRATMLYAVGKVYDDLGDIDRAFAAYDEGAKLYATAVKYDPAPSANLLKTVLSEFDSTFLSGLKPSECQSDRPIFVTGVPRSGTTLVEHILCAHSAVDDGAEINLFRTAVMALDMRSSDAVRAFEQNPARNAWTHAGETYLHLLDERFGRGGRVVDKTLMHSFSLGFIHQTLPDAPIIWMRRDPRDTALSCYRTRFASQGVDWTWSLTDIAQRFREDDALHEHWTRELGSKLLTIQYEDFVADPETWIPRILAHCGLSDEAGVRAFHTSSRAVATASVAQVRQPISSAAIGGWKRYEKHLAPFINAYYG
jgi:tetratricopeptide (TPR) repeat protein